jgi:hypothetical protein
MAEGVRLRAPVEDQVHSRTPRFIEVFGEATMGDGHWAVAGARRD